MLEAPFLLTSLYFANVFATNVQNATLVALGIHVFSWVAQFVGHGVFEKRAPALLDSLIQGNDCTVILISDSIIVGSIVCIFRSVVHAWIQARSSQKT